jgi:hypothetical protein
LKKNKTQIINSEVDWYEFVKFLPADVIFTCIFVCLLWKNFNDSLWFSNKSKEKIKITSFIKKIKPHGQQRADACSIEFYSPSTHIVNIKIRLTKDNNNKHGLDSFERFTVLFKNDYVTHSFVIFNKENLFEEVFFYFLKNI